METCANHILFSYTGGRKIYYIFIVETGCLFSNVETATRTVLLCTFIVVATV